MVDESQTPTSGAPSNQTRKDVLKHFKSEVTRETGLRYFAQFLSTLSQATPQLVQGTKVLVATDTEPEPYEAELSYRSAEEFEYGSKDWREHLTLGDIAQILDEGVEFLERYYSNQNIFLSAETETTEQTTVGQALGSTTLEELPSRSVLSLAEQSPETISDNILYSNRSRIWDLIQELNGIVTAISTFDLQQGEQPAEADAGGAVGARSIRLPERGGESLPASATPTGATSESGGGASDGGGGTPIDFQDRDFQRDFRRQAAWLQGHLLFTYFTAQGIDIDPNLRDEMNMVIWEHLNDLASKHPERIEELLKYPSPLTRLRLLAEIRQKLLTNTKFYVGYTDRLQEVFTAAGAPINQEQLFQAINAIGVDNNGVIPAQIQLAQALARQLEVSIPETFSLTAQDTIDALIVAEGDINAFLQAYRLEELEVIFFGRRLNIKNEAKFKELISQYYATRKAEHEMFLNREIRNPLLEKPEALTGREKRRNTDRVSSMRQAFQGYRAKGYQNEETLGALTTPYGAQVPNENDNESAQKISTLRTNLLRDFVATMSLSEKRQLYQTYANYSMTKELSVVPDEMAMVDILRGEGGLHTHALADVPEKSTALAPTDGQDTPPAPRRVNPASKGVAGKVLDKAINNPLVDKAFDFVAARAIDAVAPGAGMIAIKALKTISPDIYNTIKRVVIYVGSVLVGLSAFMMALLLAPFILAIQFGQAILGAIGSVITGALNLVGSAISSVGNAIGNFLGIGGGGGGAASATGAVVAGEGGAAAASGGSAGSVTAGAGGVSPGSGATGGGWGVGALTNPFVAAGTAVGAAGITTMIVGSSLYSAFLYPLPTITDGSVSPYVDIQKVAIQGTEFENPTDITYRIRLRAKDGFLLQPSTTRPPTDVFSVVTANSSSGTIPASEEHQAFLESLQSFAANNPAINDTDWIELGSYTIPFGSDPTSGNFVDSNVTNTFTIYFTVTNADGRPVPGVQGTIEAFSAEVICFGDCPQNQGGCWPTTGYITQLPHPLNPEASHYRADAYDIANVVGTRIYTPWDGRAVAKYEDGGLGNYVKVERISPTGGNEYYYFGHMTSQADSVGESWSSVAAGTLIGYMGSTGNSSGPHLHYELTARDGGVSGSNLTYDTSVLRQRVPQPNVTVTAPGNFVRSCYD